MIETGISLKTQELTALFVAVRLYCSFVMEFDLHTLLDSATLVTTLWVIYMIRFKLRPTYMEDKDNFAIYYVVSHHTLSFTFFIICICFDFECNRRMFPLIIILYRELFFIVVAFR